MSVRFVAEKVGKQLMQSLPGHVNTAALPCLARCSHQQIKVLAFEQSALSVSVCYCKGRQTANAIVVKMNTVELPCLAEHSHQQTAMLAFGMWNQAAKGVNQMQSCTVAAAQVEQDSTLVCWCL